MIHQKTKQLDFRIEKPIIKTEFRVGLTTTGFFRRDAEFGEHIFRGFSPDLFHKTPQS